MKADKQPTEMYTVYTCNGVTYVPHFLNESVYVGPGYDKNQTAYSAAFLVQNGAAKESRFLWKRGTFGRIKNVITINGLETYT